MKTQFRIMAMFVGALVSASALSSPSQPARSAMTVNPGSNAGTQGTGGQVEFTGSITDSSCNVDSTSANQSVDLGKWASSYFTGAGSETTKTAFHIKVKDCPSTVTTVSVLYEDDKSTPVDLGTVSRGHSVTAGASGAATGTADLEFFADYVSTSAVSAGSANGTANFNMIYN